MDGDEIRVGMRLKISNKTEGKLSSLLIGSHVHVVHCGNNGEFEVRFSTGARMLLHADDLDPIPDPFAPGEYVTCIVEHGGHGQVRGNVLLVDEYIHPSDGWFCVKGTSIYPSCPEPLGFQKSNFCASTPEEIAAYKAKQSTIEECSEPTLNNEDSVGCQTDEEPRITFTAGGQEFFIGQRVWNTYPDDGMFELGDELEVCGKPETGGSICVRGADGCIIRLFLVRDLSTTPPAPHEWKRGDWARHKDGRKAFVCGARLSHGAYGPQQLVVSFENEAITGIPASEFTFIGHTEAPE